MREESTWAKLAAVPVLAFLLAAAILAGKMALDWTPENTQLVLGSLVAITGGGVAILAITFGLFLGAAVYKRLTGQRGEQELERPAYQSLAFREPLPPLLQEGEKAGSWRSAGLEAYDLWQEEEPAVKREARYQ